MYAGVVVSGGGVHGAKLLGVLARCHEAGILEGVRLYAGTSVGGVICFLLVLGYEPCEIMKMVLESEILEKTRRSATLSRILGGEDGLAETRFVATFLCSAAERAGHHTAVTLGQLSLETGRDLCINAFDAISGENVVFSPASHPDVPAVDVVMASSSIPGVFPSVCVGGREVCVDGGVICNFMAEDASRMLQRGENLLGVTISTAYHGAAARGESLADKLHFVYALMRVPTAHLAAESCRNASAHRKRDGGAFDLCELGSASGFLTTDVSAIMTLYVEGFDFAASFIESTRKSGAKVKIE